jgi:hypothetical protein
MIQPMHHQKKKNYIMVKLRTICFDRHVLPGNAALLPNIRADWVESKQTVAS